MVNIASDSTRSLQSPYHGLVNSLGGAGCGAGHRDGDIDTYDDDSDDESSSRTERLAGSSPTPSEAGLALVSTCSSSSDTSDDAQLNESIVIVDIKPPPRTDSLLQDVLVMRHSNSKGVGLNRCTSSSGGIMMSASNSRTLLSSVTTTESIPSAGDAAASDVGNTFGTTQSMPSSAWRRSHSWRRLLSHQPIIVSVASVNNLLEKKCNFLFYF